MRVALRVAVPALLGCKIKHRTFQDGHPQPPPPPPPAAPAPATLSQRTSADSKSNGLPGLARFAQAAPRVWCGLRCHVTAAGLPSANKRHAVHLKQARLRSTAVPKATSRLISSMLLVAFPETSNREPPRPKAVLKKCHIVTQCHHDLEAACRSLWYPHSLPKHQHERNHHTPLL